MKSIGIKLADGSFYPIMEDGKSDSKTLQLTTVKDNQTTVKVDLYQSESGSMADAEYLDTLQIEDLNPHPNGEPDFNLSISLDDNNNLSASVNDPETKKSAAKEVPFIKRSAEERENTSPIAQADDITDIDVNDFDEVTGDGELPPNEDAEISLEGDSALSETEDDGTLPDLNDLDLSAIDEVTDEPTIEEIPENTAIEEPSAPEAEETAIDSDLGEPETPESENVDVAENESSSIDDFDLPEIADIEPSADIETADEPAIEEIPENTAIEEPSAPEAEETAIDSDLDADIDLDSDSIPSTEDVDLSEFGLEDNDEPIVENAPVRDATADDSAIPEAADDSEDADDDGISLDITTSIPVDDEADFEMPEPENVSEPESAAETEMPTTSDDFELPDLDENPISEPEEKKDESADDFSLDSLDDLDNFGAETSVSSDENSDFDTSALDGDMNENPESDFSAGGASDFDMDSADSSAIDMGDTGTSDTSFDLPDDFGDSDVSGGTVVSDSGLDLSDLDNDPAFSGNFDVPDFDDPKVKGESFSFDDDFNDPAFALPTSDSSGYSSESYDSPMSSGVSYSDDTGKKRGMSAAAVICVICAIICLAATAVALFVLPSKLNIQNLLGREQNTSAISSAENAGEIAEKTESAAPKARENEIVVSPVADVVPEKPEVLSEITEDTGEDGSKKEVDGIQYKIRWGDTLWDIADTYYRNPWLYPRIAKYNNITDPDFIVSGTTIIIPK